MIGSAIMKYARGHGMTCDGGFAYGKVNGRYIALEDGMGTKTLHIYVYPPHQNTVENEEKMVRVRHALLDCDASEYRLMKQNPLVVEEGRASVIFHDMIGTMSRIERYIDEILPRLNDLELAADACAHCGKPLEEDVQIVLLDGKVLPVHADCAKEMSRQIELQELEPKPGSVFRGALGALVGAVIGAIPWALVLMVGYVTSVVGFVIGFLSNWFYGKFGGKNSGVRVVVVFVALIIGIGLGQAVGYSMLFADEYGSQGGFDELGVTVEQYVAICWDMYWQPDENVTLGNVYDRMMSNVPEEELDLYVSREEFIEMLSDPQYDSNHRGAQRELISNLAMGIFFGILGCAGMFKQMFSHTRRRKVKALK